MTAAVVALAAVMPASVSAQRTTGAEEATFAAAYIYSFIQNTVPLSFCVHDVDYETLYPEHVYDPVNFDCKVFGPMHHQGWGYTRACVIPTVIRVGMYSMHPKEMTNAAFQQTGIKSLDMRARIRTIPQNAFMFCTDLEMVKFHGDAPHFIEASAFRGCTKLRLVEGLPAQLKYIGDDAFNQCLALTEIYIPKDVEYIGPRAFNYCQSLSKVEFATGHFRRIPEECFNCCDKLREITIPEGVESLGKNAFNYSGLEKITLPATMRALYDGCLSQTPLKDIYIHATTPPGVGRVFTGRQINSIVLHVPASAIDAYRADPFWRLFPHIQPL